MIVDDMFLGLLFTVPKGLISLNRKDVIKEIRENQSKVEAEAL